MEKPALGALGVTVTAPFVCECGQPPSRDGDFWVCQTPACDGEGQICRALTVEEKAKAQEIEALRFEL